MARAKYRTYHFTPINREKCKNEKLPLVLRSSWELEFAKHCDLLPNVIQWAYESVSIPYRDPITGKQKVYLPDFMVIFVEPDGKPRFVLFEIKPSHEQSVENARNRTDALVVARNRAKWTEAVKWATRHSAEFRVINEKDLFSFTDQKRMNTKTVVTHQNPATKKHKRIVGFKSKTGKNGRTTRKRGKPRVGSRKIRSSARTRKPRR